MALGAVPRRVVELVQMEVDERIRKAGREPTSLPGRPRSPRRALAATQGKQQAKKARDAAKLLQKRLTRFNQQWWDLVAQSERHYYDQGKWKEWRDQQKAVDEAWDRAEWLSDEAGHPYENRAGIHVNARGDTSIVNVVLRSYEKECRRPGGCPRGSESEFASSSAEPAPAQRPLPRRRAREEHASTTTTPRGSAQPAAKLPRW